MKYLMITILIFAAIGCKIDFGTDNPFTGNSEADEDAASCIVTDDGRCLLTPYVVNQSKQICDKVNSCLGVAYGQDGENCSRILPYQTGLENYNQPAQKYYAALNTLYQNKKINVNARNWDECLAAINALACDSAVFTSAFNVNDPTNYSNIHTILTVSESCANIYTLK
jgi:hypothetical protein